MKAAGRLLWMSVTLLACATEPDNTPATLAADSATDFTGIVATTVTQQPSVRVTNAAGKGLAGVAVSFQVSQGGGSVQGPGTTDASGIARVSWTLGTTAGLNVVIVAIADLGQTVTFTAIAAAGPPANVTPVGGAATQQAAQVGSTLINRPAAQVTDAFGNPNAGTQVVFSVTAGGGSIADSIQTTSSAGVATSGDWTIGKVAGANTVTATIPGVSAGQAVFTAIGTSAAAAHIRKSAGDEDTVVAGTAVSTPPTVKVVDAFDNPVSGVVVTFAAEAGTGTITGAQQQTNAQGLAAVGSWVLDRKAGTNRLSAGAPGLTSVTFAATGKAGPIIRIALSPDTLQLSPGDTISLTAAASDANGNTVSSPPLAWLSTNTAKATVSAGGHVKSLDTGTVKIIVSSGIPADTTIVVARPGSPDVVTTNTRGITSSSIWLGASVVQRADSTKVWFEWSTSATLSGASATTKTLLGSGVTGNNRRISGLLPNTTYYYRALAENVAGKDTGAIAWSKTSPSGGMQLLRQTGLSGTTSRAEFDVPAGTTRLEVSAQTASTAELAFLSLRFGAAAEVNAADCVSGYFSTAGETQLQACAMDNPQVGRWHVLLVGAYSNVTLTALAHGIPEPIVITISPTSDSLAVGSARQYSAKVTGASDTTVTWTSSNTTVADVSASGLVTAKALGQTTIRARSKADTSKSATATLNVVALAPAVITLANDVPISPLGGSGGAIQYFKFTVPQGAPLVAVRTLGGTGDVNMLIRKGSLPNDGQYDCRSSNSPTTEEVCELTPATFNPTSSFYGDWYVYLTNGLGAQYADVKLVATYDSTSLNAVTTLQNNASVPGLNDTTLLSLKHHFKIAVPAGMTSLSVTVSGSVVPDFYVEYKRQPVSTTSNFVCLADGRNKTSVACNMDNPASGYWYIALWAFRKYTGVTLTVRYQ